MCQCFTFIHYFFNHAYFSRECFVTYRFGIGWEIRRWYFPISYIHNDSTMRLPSFPLFQMDHFRKKDKSFCKGNPSKLFCLNWNMTWQHCLFGKTTQAADGYRWFVVYEDWNCSCTEKVLNVNLMPVPHRLRLSFVFAFRLTAIECTEIFI